MPFRSFIFSQDYVVWMISASWEKNLYLVLRTHFGKLVVGLSNDISIKLKLSRIGTFRTNYSSADSRTDHQITGNCRDFSWSGSNEQQWRMKIYIFVIKNDNFPNQRRDKANFILAISVTLRINFSSKRHTLTVKISDWQVPSGLQEQNYAKFNICNFWICGT